LWILCYTTIKGFNVNKLSNVGVSGSAFPAGVSG
jgi:hypothetical protein